MLSTETEQKRSTRGVRGARGINRIPKGLIAGRIKTPALVAPIEQFTDDVRAIKEAPLTKMSHTTLKYLKDAKVISGDQYAVYMVTQEKPEDRTIISEKNTIEHLNIKLLELYRKA